MIEYAKKLGRQARGRARREIKKWKKSLDPLEREFRRVWPLIDQIEGYLISPAQERWLFRTARSLPEDAVIAEIGSFKGRSTCALAYGCRDSRKRVYAIDTFAGNEVDFLEGKQFDSRFFEEFRSNLTARGLFDYVEPVFGLSGEVVKTWSREIDLLYIDGSHEYEDVRGDYLGFFPHVKPGGIVAFHDVVETWPGPVKVWHELAAPELSDLGSVGGTLKHGRKPR